MPEETSNSSFWDALAAAQAEFPMIVADTDGQAGNHKYKYAPLDTVWPAVREILTKYELVWSCTPTLADSVFVMQYALMHAPTGQGVTGMYPLPDGRPQDIGSALTYARRYALCAVLGLVVAGDDDDASAANVRATTTRNRGVESRQVEEAEPPNAAGLKDMALALLAHVGTLPDLVNAWGEIGRMGYGLQKDTEVIELKNKRKAELS